MSFETKVQHNIWDRDLNEVIKTINELTEGSDKFDWDKNWMWIRNGRCKYISIRIDMRDGAFVLVDRDGERISLEHLKFQYDYKDESKKPPKGGKDSKYDAIMLNKAKDALQDIMNSNHSGGGEGVFDTAAEALKEINEHLGIEC